MVAFPSVVEQVVRDHDKNAKSIYIYIYRLEMCYVSTNGERASPAIDLAISLFSLNT